MTTATASTFRGHVPSGYRVLIGTGAVALVAGLALTGVAAVVADDAAVLGALIGTVLTVAVFAFGLVVVETVARVTPSLSLLVALLTYTFQVLALALIFAALGSGAIADTIDGRWLGVAMIVATGCWIVAQIALGATRRIPTYELDEGNAQ